MKTKNKLWMVCLVSIAISSCGGGGGKEKITLTKAADQFVTGNYTTALRNFENLIASEGAPAAAGAGWCLVRLSNVARADSFFVTVAADSNTDAYAGWSFSSWALNDPSEAISRADFVIRKDANFQMSLDTRVTKNHLVWIQASSYLQLGDYTSCFNKIKILDAAYTYPTGTSVEIGTALMQKLQTLGAAS